MIKIIYTILIALLVYGSYTIYKLNKPTEVQVINQSDYTVKKLICTGREFEIKVDQLLRNESYVFYPTIEGGESSLEISFLMNDESYSKSDLAYLQNKSYGRKYIITISNNGNIKTQLETN